MNRAIARQSSLIVVSMEQACHAGSRGSSPVLSCPGLPLGEHVRELSQGEGDREEALRRDVVLAVASLGALVGRERVQFVFMRPRPQNLGHGHRDAVRVLRAVSSSSFRRSGVGIEDSRNAGSNPAGGIATRMAEPNWLNPCWVDKAGELREVPGYAGNAVPGPAIVWTPITTLVIPPGQAARLDESRNVLLSVGA
jgi:hypothetical protein